MAEPSNTLNAEEINVILGMMNSVSMQATRPTIRKLLAQLDSIETKLNGQLLELNSGTLPAPDAPVPDIIQPEIKSKAVQKASKRTVLRLGN